MQIQVRATPLLTSRMNSLMDLFLIKFFFYRSCAYAHLLPCSFASVSLRSTLRTSHVISSINVRLLFLLSLVREFFRGLKRFSRLVFSGVRDDKN